jgi:hypothetical protein
VCCCSCPVDEFIGKNAKELKNHLLALHGWDIDFDADNLTHSLGLTFETDKQFHVWKQALEAQSHSQYGKRRGTRRNKRSTVETYTCVTDGLPRYQGDGARPLRSKPSVRLGSHCLSQIQKTTHEDGTIMVLFIPVHTSHSIDPFISIHRQSLSSTTKTAMRTMIEAGQSTTTILNEVRGAAISRLHRDRFDAVVHRDHFVTRQDMTNLCTLDLERGLRKHLDDTFSLHLWVTQLMLEPDSPVVYYKPPGVHDPLYPDVPTNGLLLVLATTFMLDTIEANVTRVYVCEFSGEGQVRVTYTR